MTYRGKRLLFRQWVTNLFNKWWFPLAFVAGLLVLLFVGTLVVALFNPEPV